MASDISMVTHVVEKPAAAVRGGTLMFWTTKRFLDIVISLLALPLVTVISILLLLFNPFFNRGPLMYRQERMGLDLKPFVAIKFRTMVPSDQVTRKANDPVERERITPLGGLLRRTRVDELPQFINILTGDMALIGPRPDFMEHAEEYLTLIPEYRERHSVRPGLTGLSQVTLGYVQGVEETRFKAQTDLAYIEKANLLMDLKILWLTVFTLASFEGQ